eukprot:TRINITY_DN8371_c0_g1_i2.p1 TRINITY_DN8371_c0_g1~~TRINITY_DN8371_c0_g1_i2.p1  ORF type:complete len:738 (+),score=239.95 TRINITY_DN8371_c0_g1_i2:74-2287(+)
MATKKAKIIIKPFRHQVQMDPHYAEQTWKLLKHAIHEIHKKNASVLSFEELYRNAYNMVLHKYGDMLYAGLREVVHERLREVAAGVSASNEENLLERLNDAWKDHKVSMLMIRDILMYMDRVHVVSQGVAPVYDLGLVLFRDVVVTCPELKDRLLHTLLSLIRKERIGEAINRSLIKSTTQMLVDLGVNSRRVYEEYFEEAFLESTALFYRVESQEFIASNSCPDYMRKVEVRRQEELDRVRHYLDSSSEPKVREVVEEELIANHVRTLIEMEGSGLLPMLRDDQVEDLSRMYNLFSKVRCLEAIKTEMSQYVRQCGKAIVNDTEKIKEHGAYVQALLDLKDKYDHLLREAFRNDRSFQHALDLTFEHFINLNRQSPELISIFIDDKLKRGVKECTDEEIEIILNKVMMLFRYIQEKDVFEKFYKQHLARRLLLGKSLSDTVERGMIERLKVECGYQFTSKLEGMFNDIRQSTNTMENFRAHLESSTGVSTAAEALYGIELNVQVLTTGFWPTQSVSPCTFPPSVHHCVEVFTKYYLSKYSGRCLTFQPNMGTAELKMQLGKAKHEVSVSTYQMCILMLFNESTSFSYGELLSRTGIPGSEMERQLISLARYRLILKEPRTRVFKDTDVISLNMNFKCKLFKFKVQTAASTNSQKNREVTRERVDEDRKHQIEACIVRVMKSRKSMQHALLVSEVCSQLASRFRPKPLVIKKRIESLIEREYLERAQGDRKVYNYLA